VRSHRQLQLTCETYSAAECIQSKLRHAGKRQCPTEVAHSSGPVLLLLLPQGWGLSSLDQDASELRLLAQCLAEHHDSNGWVLMGHSTGCQDAVRLASARVTCDKCVLVVCGWCARVDCVRIARTELPGGSLVANQPHQTTMSVSLQSTDA
jgi:pimeloyl-ACP methyl ester carboxylesterase